MQLCLSLAVHVIFKEGYAAVSGKKNNLQPCQRLEAEVMSFGFMKQLWLLFMVCLNNLKKKGAVQTKFIYWPT